MRYYGAMNLRFEPLSYERLEEALALVSKIFPEYLGDIREAYEVSLKKDKTDPYWITDRILDYWVVIDNETEKIVATTGFYQLTEHSVDEIWMGWYGVDPEERGNGLGRKVLEWTVAEARRRGYECFRLWTTDDAGEVAANKLYDSVGLNIYKKEFIEKEGYTKFYRELKL
jgi:GNAT superfamily N-acetyltransferase